MNENLQKLYDTLTEQGLYTKTFEEFVAKYDGNINGQEKIFDEVAKRGLYTKTREEFKGKYFPATVEEPVKKKDEPTDSRLESGLSGRSALTIDDINATEELPEAAPEQPDFSSYGDQEEPLNEQAFVDALTAEPELDPFSEEGILAARKKGFERTTKVKAEEAKKDADLAEQELIKRHEGFYKSADEMADSFVTPELISKNEEEVVRDMSEKFGQYGFNFIEKGVGDAMTVYNHDQSASIDIDLDPFTDEGKQQESAKLRDFIKSHYYKEGQSEVEVN